MDFKQIFDFVKGLIRGGWQYRWIAMVVSLAVATIGWSTVALLPDYYKASARVYIDTQSLIQPLMKDISVTIDSDFRIQKMTKTLLSLPNLEKIAQMSDLDLHYASRYDKEAFLKKLEKNIQFKQTPKANLYQISYENENPDLAKLVVESLINLFMEMTLSDTRTDTVVAKKFLDEQIKTYEARLIAAEKQLAEFKRNHVEHLPQRDQTYHENLQDLKKQLNAAEMEFMKAQGRMRSLDQQAKGEAPILGLSYQQDLKALHPRIRILRDHEEALEVLRQKYTAKHPDVMKLEDEIIALNLKIDKELSQERWEYSAQELSKNPVYQQIKIQLSDSNATIAALNSEKEEIQRQISLMEEKVDLIIGAEAKLSNLNRDYLLNKNQYQALLKKREAAKFVEDIDDTAENFKFKIIDPPYVSSTPSKPKRDLLNFGVLCFSLFMGLTAVIVTVQIKPTFWDKNSLQNELKLPVLGVVPFEKSKISMQLTQRENRVLMSLLTGLFGVFLMLYVLTSNGSLLP